MLAPDWLCRGCHCGQHCVSRSQLFEPPLGIGHWAVSELVATVDDGMCSPTEMRLGCLTGIINHHRPHLDAVPANVVSDSACRSLNPRTVNLALILRTPQISFHLRTQRLTTKLVARFLAMREPSNNIRHTRFKLSSAHGLVVSFVVVLAI